MGANKTMDIPDPELASESADKAAYEAAISAVGRFVPKPKPKFGKKSKEA